MSGLAEFLQMIIYILFAFFFPRQVQVSEKVAVWKTKLMQHATDTMLDGDIYTFLCLTATLLHSIQGHTFEAA